MVEIDREPGGSTMIRVDNETHDMLDAAKIIPREPYDACIKRLVRENQQLKKIYFTTQTRERMETDIKNFVLNPDVPDTKNNHREIYSSNHPKESLTPADIIHHINGNHDDNRPENLQKVTPHEHASLHSKLNDTLGVSKN